jgi:hypothetical protein
MVDDVNAGVERALASLVSITERSGNLRIDLRKYILEAVSSLRNYFVQLKSNLEAETAAHNKLAREAKDNKEEIRRLRVTESTRTRHAAPSLDQRLNGNGSTWQVLPPNGKSCKLYSEVAKMEGNADKRYKLTVKSRTNQSAETVRNIIKTSINPTSMKVGICALRSLQDGRVLLETKSKEELELLHSNIKDNCSQQLEANIQKLRNPNIVIYNIPEDVTIESAGEIILTQNPELDLSEGDLKPKFIYKGRRGTRNLVIEVSSLVRRRIFKTKLKIGWHICSTGDYTAVTRCYKCSGYNHRASSCRGVETCPLCTVGHKLKDCTTSAEHYKCINCAKYNKYNNNAKVDENHSSMDQNCPSLQATLLRYKQNTDY